MPAPALTTCKAFGLDTINVIAALAPQTLVEEALAQIAFYEQKLSRFVEGSDVWRLNHARGAATEVGADTLAILHCAEELRQASSGAFNIAVGAACALWDFSASPPTLPDADALAAAATSLQNSSPLFEGSQVTLPPGIQIDLGGIAKGYICDRVADYLREREVASALLNFGGNVVTIGRNPAGRHWQVGLQAPEAPRDTRIFALVESSDGAVVTSGVYERSFELDGRLYHHILDPRSCWPAQSKVCSATVVCSSALQADALTTALLVLGPEEGIALAERLGVEAALLSDDGTLDYTDELPIRLLTASVAPRVEIPLIG